jgi:hypothetical protein
VLVYERPLSEPDRAAVAAHLRHKFRLFPGPSDGGAPAAAASALGPGKAAAGARAGAGGGPPRVCRRMLEERLREARAAGLGRGGRLELPPWLDRYIKCFQARPRRAPPRPRRARACARTRPTASRAQRARTRSARAGGAPPRGVAATRARARTHC